MIGYKVQLLVRAACYKSFLCNYTATGAILVKILRKYTDDDVNYAKKFYNIDHNCQCYKFFWHNLHQYQLTSFWF
jgi:hypothetical protein